MASSGAAEHVTARATARARANRPRVLALDIVAGVARSPAAWLFAAAWLGSALVLVVSGLGFPFFSLLSGSGYLLLSLLTVALTRAAPAPPAAPAERPRLWLQVGLLLPFVALTAWGGLAFHRPPALGFGRGHRVGRVLLLWCALPLIYLAYALLSGRLAPGRLLMRFVSNFMQNGLFEEFLFRGALQTRLRRLWTPGWALVAQALVFGAWHLGLGYTNTGHAGLLPALASTVVNQAVIGLALGVLFERTRNLLAPSVAHIIANSLG